VTNAWPRDPEGQIVTRSELEQGYEPLIRAASRPETSSAVEKLKAALKTTEWRAARITDRHVRALLKIRVGPRPTTSLVTALFRANEDARLAEWQRSRAVARSKVPPKWMEVIARIFTKPELREYVLGCRAEEFGQNVEKYSRWSALLLYWCDIVRGLPVWRIAGAGIIAGVWRRIWGL
jgi:hypothetical protein